MITLAIPFPMIDPVLVEIGPLAIRWYALAYMAGILLGWRYVLRLAAEQPGGADGAAIDDLVAWMVLGVILGGRLGYVLFYKPSFYLADPLEVLFVWHGGMSFHGGLAGVVITLVLFARRRGLALFALADVIACAAPIGLFFGRIANFINGELWGRVTDVPWAVVFLHGGPDPRHPSQIYEALLEGAALFLVLFTLWRLTGLRRRHGVLAGVFFCGYGVARITVEFFREPDAFLGFLLGGATMGQLLSLPVIAFGLWLMLRRAPGSSP